MHNPFIAAIVGFYSQGGWRKQLVDQSGHFAWGYTLAWPAAALGGAWWVCILSALIGAIPRELWDQRPIHRWRDTILDLAVFAAGGAFMWWVI